MQARVEAAGGHILYWNGVRVMGVLAVSRAIGDHCLRPFVIAEPEVSTLLNFVHRMLAKNRASSLSIQILYMTVISPGLHIAFESTRLFNALSAIRNCNSKCGSFEGSLCSM